MKPYSKVLFFILITIFFLPSCSNDETDVVPDTFVNFTINLNNFPIGVTQSMIITSSMTGQPSLGYNNNGVIIYRNDLNEFYAYDRTCTYHVDQSIPVIIYSGSSLFAICPVCSTLYQLNFSGFPTDEGPSTIPLKQYRTYYNPNTMDLNVTNF